MEKTMKSPVLVETALLGRGLPSIDNQLIKYLWSNENITLPYAKDGVIIKGKLEEILGIRQQNDWQRLDAEKLKNINANRLNGFLTASALIRLAIPHNLVVTAGIGGITRERISQDLITIVDKPVLFISSGFKDVIDAKASLKYLERRGIKVLGWKNPIYDGFIFPSPSYKLDGIVDENNIHNIDSKADKGILIFNALPSYLKIQNKEILTVAEEQICLMLEKGLDFHPQVNELLDEHTNGYASFIQLLALIANINLAEQLSRCLGGL